MNQPIPPRPPISQQLNNVEKIPQGRKLPYWEAPRSAREAIAKINNATRDWEKTTEDFVYRAGKWFFWLKHKTRGEFELTIKKQTRFSPRTVRNFITYAK